jgi:hypothetical protein
VSVAVTENALPPNTAVGVNVTVDTTGARTVRYVPWRSEPSVTARDTCVSEATAVVVIGNEADVVPAGIVPEAATLATDGLPLERPTVKPPVGAGPFKVTTSEGVAPPVADVEVGATERSAGVDVTVRSKVRVSPPDVAPTRTETGKLRADVTVTGKIANVPFCGTVTVAGTLATLVFDENSVTTSPPAPAGPFSVTVALTTAPLTALVAAGVRESTTA